jgi:hypothetical protein
MPYAQVSNVRDLAPHVPINDQSQPSQGVVQTWISDVESTLNATLAAYGYTIPLVAKTGKTTDAAIRVLRQMVANAVMAMVMRARPNPETDPENFQRRYDAILKQLREPSDPFELPDVEITGEAAIKESPTRISSNLKELAALEPERVNRFQVF